MMPSSSNSAPQHSNRHRAHEPRAPKHPMIRWSALATGSLVGIAAWALLYVVGALLATVCQLTSAPTPVWGQWAVGLYGSASASLALALAAYMAARTGGAHTEENALMYGLCLWSLSSITLVVVAHAALAGCVPAELTARLPLLTVGLAAVGLGGQAQAEATPAVAYLGMTATLLLSLWVALWGASRSQAHEQQR